MHKRSSLFTLMSIIIMAVMLLSACNTGAPAADQADAEESTGLAVGIVLPTKDEPRWIQDETRFQDALQAAGYEVEILFSQGDSAKELANVEALITKGIKVLVICPQDGNAAAAAADAAREAPGAEKTQQPSNMSSSARLMRRPHP